MKFTGEGEFKYQGQTRPIGGRLLGMVLAILSMEKDLAGHDKAQIVLNCAGQSVKPEVRLFGEEVQVERDGERAIE